eukprot:736819-Prymnesium_polylepis.1
MGEHGAPTPSGPSAKCQRTPGTGKASRASLVAHLGPLECGEGFLVAWVTPREIVQLVLSIGRSLFRLPRRQGVAGARRT